MVHLPIRDAMGFLSVSKRCSIHKRHQTLGLCADAAAVVVAAVLFPFSVRIVYFSVQILLLLLMLAMALDTMVLLLSIHIFSIHNVQLQVCVHRWHSIFAEGDENITVHMPEFI